MRGFICAMTRPPRARTASTAAGRMLTSIPSETFPLPRGGGVQQHDVGWAHRREQPRDERQAHRQVVQPLSGVAHAGPDERRLEDHALAQPQRRLGGEHEQPVALHGSFQGVEQSAGVARLPLATTRGSGPVSAARALELLF